MEILYPAASFNFLTHDMCLYQVCHCHHRRYAVPADIERTGCPGAGQRLHEAICVSCSEGQLPRAARNMGKNSFASEGFFNLHIKGSGRGRRFIHAIRPQFFQVREQEVYWLHKNDSAYIIITTGYASGEPGSGTEVWCIIFLRSSGQTELFPWIMFMYFFEGGVSFC